MNEEEIKEQTKNLEEQRKKEARFKEQFLKKPKNEQESAHGGIKAVLEFLHRDKDTKGDVRQDHLAVILSYLYGQRSEELRVTLAKLALLVGVDSTHLKRNYLDGLIAFGILEVAHSKDGQVWVSIGVH